MMSTKTIVVFVTLVIMPTFLLAQKHDYIWLSGFESFGDSSLRTIAFKFQERNRTVTQNDHCRSTTNSS